MDDEQVLRRELRVAADRIDNLTTERNMLAQRAAELEATAADLRRVNDALRARLADAEDVRRDEAEVERLRAEVADVRTFAGFQANKARRLAEQLRSGPVTCARWVGGEDGHRLVIPETLLGSVFDSDPSDASVSWRVEPTVEWGVQSGTVDDRGNVAAAKRIVEALTGVRL